jgi:hypothetical protein
MAAQGTRRCSCLARIALLAFAGSLGQEATDGLAGLHDPLLPLVSTTSVSAATRLPGVRNGSNVGEFLFCACFVAVAVAVGHGHPCGHEKSPANGGAVIKG